MNLYFNSILLNKCSGSGNKNYVLLTLLKT